MSSKELRINIVLTIFFLSSISIKDSSNIILEVSGNIIAILQYNFLASDNLV